MPKLRPTKPKKAKKEKEEVADGPNRKSQEALFDQIETLQHFSFQEQSKLDTAKDPLLQFGNNAEDVINERPSILRYAPPQWLFSLFLANTLKKAHTIFESFTRGHYWVSVFKNLFTVMD